MLNRLTSYMLFAVSLLCFACTGSNESRKKLETELTLLKSTPITLPDKMLATNCNDEALPDTTLLYRPLKMVVYVNHDGC